jgi:hypothetical protein
MKKGSISCISFSNAINEKDPSMGNETRHSS